MPAVPCAHRARGVILQILVHAHVERGDGEQKAQIKAYGAKKKRDKDDREDDRDHREVVQGAALLFIPNEVKRNRKFDKRREPDAAHGGDGKARYGNPHRSAQGRSHARIPACDDPNNRRR